MVKPMKLFSRKGFLVSTLCTLLGVCSPESARGQVTYVSLGTVQATIATNVACTGAAQNFTTSQGIANFRNLGQTQHLASATSNASSFQMEIDGIDNLGLVYRISDPQIGIPASAQTGIVVQASGYFPNIQISVLCSAGGTFSISYYGSSSTPITNIAGALVNALDKIPFQNQPANVNKSITFQTPYGTSSGTILFQYNATGPSGSVITAQCISNAGSNLTLFTFNPTTANTLQLFPVSAASCPFVTLTYTSGGATAATYTMEYIFNAPGTIASGGGNVQGTVASGSSAVGQNPLDAGGVEPGTNLALPVSVYRSSTGAPSGNGFAIGAPGYGPTSQFTSAAGANGGQPLFVLPMGMINNGTTVTGIDVSLGACSPNIQCPGQYVREAGYAKLSGQTATTDGTFGLWQGVNSSGIFQSCRVDLQVTAASGTTPTLDVYLQDSPDNTTWTDRLHFAQAITTGNQFGAIATAAGITPTPFTNKTLAAATKVDGPIDAFGQIAWHITGTGPSFTFTVTTVCR
jgi:hypothetical protein